MNRLDLYTAFKSGRIVVSGTGQTGVPFLAGPLPPIIPLIVVRHAALQTKDIHSLFIHPPANPIQTVCLSVLSCFISLPLFYLKAGYC